MGQLTPLAYKKPTYLHEQAFLSSANPLDVVSQELLKGTVVLLEVDLKQLFSLVS